MNIIIAIQTKWCKTWNYTSLVPGVEEECLVHTDALPVN